MSGDLDVVVVGAGLSGIDAACRLKTKCPEKRFAILEARGAIGGTWDLFRYPGIRSDSDMFTFGFPFHPWKGHRVGSGASILEYLREAASRYGIDPHLRFRHRVVAARWSSEEARWTLEVEAGEERRPERLRCRFLFLCTGYYRYDAAHAPTFPGMETFRGRIVHPQWWPDDLDHAGQRVVVIGSGATAVTLVPAMSERAAHVTMVQRSPSYVGVLPERDRLAEWLRAIFSAWVAHRIVRAKNVALGLGFYLFCRRFPRAARRFFRRQATQHLPPGYPVDLHFRPRYDPWDQRVCLAPNGDLFQAISAGKVTVVTGTIDRFTERGLRMESGEELEADLVVTATGLKMLPLGGISLEVDGRPLEARDAFLFRSAMLSGAPNLAWSVGYASTSWTLRSDLTARFVCRLLKYMDRHGHDAAVPVLEGGEPERRPVLPLTSGYVVRSAEEMPKGGSRPPWIVRQNYLRDLLAMTQGRVEHPALVFSRARYVAAAAPEVAPEP